MHVRPQDDWGLCRLRPPARLPPDFPGLRRLPVCGHRLHLAASFALIEAGGCSAATLGAMNREGRRLSDRPADVCHGCWSTPGYEFDLDCSGGTGECGARLVSAGDSWCWSGRRCSSKSAVRRRAFDKCLTGAASRPNRACGRELSEMWPRKLSTRDNVTVASTSNPRKHHRTNAP